MMLMMMMMMIVCNCGPTGHKLQWFKGVMYGSYCVAWTAKGGRPKKLVQQCPGRDPSPPGFSAQPVKTSCCHL
eukprot:8627254-Karenia_brevis.AAC.1